MRWGRSCATSAPARGSTTAPTPAAPQTNPGEGELAEALRQVERHKARAAAMEEREGLAALREQALKKEAEKHSELCRRHEGRIADLTNAVKPALLRVAELTKEVERLKKERASQP